MKSAIAKRLTLVLALSAALAVGLGAWTAYRTFLQPSVVAPYSAQDRRMTFADFVDWMAKEADSAWRRYLRRTPTYARGAM